MSCGFKKSLDTGSGRGFEAGFCLDGRGNSRCDDLSGLKAHVKAAREEAFQDFKVSGGKARNSVHGQREGGVRFRNRRGGGEDLGGESAGGELAPEGSFLLAIPDYESAGGQVAQPLVLSGDEDGDDSDGVKEGKLVNVTDQVTGHGLEEADAAAGALDDADSCHALAGGATVPEGLEEREVAPIEKENKKDDERHGPLLGGSGEGKAARCEKRSQNGKHQDRCKPDQVIDEQGDEAAADAGERKLDVHELRRGDIELLWVKLV